MRRLLLIALLLAPMSLWGGNACTTTATGTDWGTVSHWTSCGGTIPQPGDTVTIANATTLASGQTADIGTSPASGGTVALTINAALTVNGTLIVRGPVTQGNAAVTFGAGAVLEFNAANATTPLSQTYAWTSNAYVRGNRMITCNGTSGNHVTIRSNASGGNGYFYSTTAYSDSMWFTCTYADFVRIGDAVNNAISFNPSSDTTINTLKNVTFDANSGRVEFIGAVPSGGGWDFEDVRFLQTNAKTNTGTTHKNPLVMKVANSASSATRKIYRSVFMVQPYLAAPGADTQDNYFHLGFDDDVGGWAYLWTYFKSNFARSTDVQTKTVTGSADGNYFVVDESTQGNPHFYAPSNYVTSGTIAFTNNVFEYTGPAYNMLPNNDWGDATLLPNLAITLNVSGNIVLPNTPGTDTSGTLFTIFTADTAFTSVVAEHNTYPLSMKHSASLNETNGGTNMATGKVTFRDNIAWLPPGVSYAATRCKVGDVAHEANPALSPQDFLAVADYNAGWGVDACYAGKGYNVNLSYTPGVHDVDVDPQFVDSTRNLATWAVTQGSASGTQAGKIADALSYLQADPTLTRTSLIPYIRAGFAPQNAALATAAHDGTTIGAVAYQAPAAAGVRKRVTVVQ